MATIIQILQNALNSSEPTLTNETKRIRLHEALQSLVLDFIYNHPVYRGMNFYGCTCLHVIYYLNRMSEDIDLDNSHDVKLEDIIDKLSDHFSKILSYRDLSLKYQESQ
jgi:hypothetical protein